MNWYQINLINFIYRNSQKSQLKIDGRKKKQHLTFDIFDQDTPNAKLKNDANEVH